MKQNNIIEKTTSFKHKGINYDLQLKKPIANWIKSNIKDFKKKDIDIWIEHSIHHTKKHLEDMLKLYKKGNSFNKSHLLSKIK